MRAIIPLPILALFAFVLLAGLHDVTGVLAGSFAPHFRWMFP